MPIKTREELKELFLNGTPFTADKAIDLIETAYSLSSEFPWELDQQNDLISRFQAGETLDEDALRQLSGNIYGWIVVDSGISEEDFEEMFANGFVLDENKMHDLVDSIFDSTSICQENPDLDEIYLQSFSGHIYTFESEEDAFNAFNEYPNVTSGVPQYEIRLRGIFPKELVYELDGGEDTIGNDNPSIMEDLDCLWGNPYATGPNNPWGGGWQPPLSHPWHASLEYRSVDEDKNPTGDWTLKSDNGWNGFFLLEVYKWDFENGFYMGGYDGDLSIFSYFHDKDIPESTIILYNSPSTSEYIGISSGTHWRILGEALFTKEP